MKLLFISNLYPPLSLGGYEQICHDIAVGLRARGHQITILTSSYQLSEAPANEPYVRRRMKLGKTWDGKVATSLPWLASNRFDLEVHNSSAVKQSIQELQPDLTVIWGGTNLGSTFFSTALQYSHVAFYLSDFWLIDTLAVDQELSVRASARFIYRFFLSLLGPSRTRVCGENFMFCSKSLRQAYEDRAGNLTNCTVIYHGISPSVFPQHPQHIIHREETDPFRILYVGQLRQAKGVITLINALAKLRSAAFLNVTLTLVGPTPDSEFNTQLERQVQELNLVDVVEFAGIYSREHLSNVYASHDLMVFPSEWSEPFSVTLLEGLATGIPVVASLAGGSAEIIRHSENALAFRAGDANDLAEKMARALGDPIMASRLGLEAAREVREYFTIEREVEYVETFLSGLAGAPK